MIKSIEIKNFKCFDNLRLPLSKLTILAGANAAGKSTVMNLLLRFFDVSEGEILLDGVNIKEVRQHDLRDKIGYVFG